MAALVLILGCQVFAQENQVTDTRMSDQAGVAGAVCSIYASNMNWLSLGMEVDVYSSFKVESSCNPEQFQRLSLASIEAQMRGVQKSENTTSGGVHHYVMDVNLTAVPNPYYSFGDIKFSKIGVVHVGLQQVLGRNLYKLGRLEFLSGTLFSLRALLSASYTPMSMRSDVFYIWNIGTLAHQLIAPDGRKFIMTSYTKQVSPNLTRDKLVDLGPLLNRPPDWKYESFLVTRTITVRSTELNSFTNMVLFDDLQNFYIEYFD